MKMKKLLFCVAMALLCAGCTKEIRMAAVEFDFNQSSFNSSSATAVLVGRVTDDGGDLDDAGFCYIKGTSGTPVASDNQRSCGTNKDLRVELSGLSVGTYRVRAYATNRVGTAYSDIAEFTIQPPATVPTVEWDAESSYCNASAGTAELYATVTHNGNSAVSAAGFCYIKASSGTPTVADSRWVSTDKTNLHVQLSNLADGTYLVRPYATNAQGTGYDRVMRMTVSKSGNTVTIDDFLGTWSCSAVEKFSGNTYTWTGTKIYKGNNSDPQTVWVEGLFCRSNGGEAGGYFYAFGEYDEAKQAIRLYGGYMRNNWEDYTYHYSSEPDTSLFAVFYPCYKNGSSYYALKGPDGDSHGQAMLKFNSSGQLVFSPSDMASSDGHYAEGYMFAEYYADTEQPRDWWGYGVLSGLTMTKTSSSSANHPTGSLQPTSTDATRMTKVLQ